MKKLLYILAIILLFLSFIIFEVYRKSTVQILKIINASTIQIDLNRNGVYDPGETVCIPNLNTLSANLSINQKELTDNIQISVQDGIKLGYLSDNFADNELTDKRIKLIGKKQRTNDCLISDIKVNNGSYREKLIISGYGFDKKPNENFYKNLEKAKKIEFVILNHKSGKYHTLDCEYGLIANDTIIIPESQILKDYVPCKFCHINSKKSEDNKFAENFPQFVTSGSIKMYLTDSTTKLKPDNKCDTEVCKDIVKSINNSKESIDIALYGWDSVTAMLSALKNAKQRGVKIRIVYDISSNNYYPKTQEIIEIADKKTCDSIKGLMHNKFLIIDGKELYTGSMNFSKTGLSGFNTNNIFYIKSTDIANAYKNEFEQMLSGRFKTQKKSLLKKRFILGDTAITPLFSPKDRIIVNNIIPLINNSKKYVYLPVFILTHESLSKALINAKNRGVNVKIITDATNVNSAKSKIKYLRDAGIPVKTENYAGKLHSKSIIIDDKYIISGSMNFTNSGENKNDENILIIENYKLANYYKKFFEYYWKKIPDKYLKYNPSAEGHFSIGSCSDGIDNNYDGNIDLKDKHCSSN